MFYGWVENIINNMINNLSKIVINNGGSITPLLIPSTLTDGTGLCNVSVFIDDNGEILANIRHVHYTLYHSEFNQRFYCGWGTLAYLNPEDDICLKTGNYLCKLDPDTLEVTSHQKIDTSKHDTPPVWTFIGLEDVRVFRWDGILYVCGVRRDTKPDGEGRMELCKVDWKSNSITEVTRDRIEPPGDHTYLEKNWMPILDMPYHFVRWANPLEIVKVHPESLSSEIVISKDNKIKLPLSLRGSSQVIPFGEDRICITHEVDFFHHPGYYKDAFYYHRFIIWDKDWNLKSLSKPFSFMSTQIEFNTGLALKDDNFIITYGYQDNAAYALKMPVNLLDKLEWEDVNQSIEKVTWHEPLIYSKTDYNNFKFKFKGLKNILQNYSQCYQDLFVLYILKGKKKGTYLEIGAGKPFYGNNTALLKEFNWSGISLEINQSLINQWLIERPNDIILNEDATNVDFNKIYNNNLPKSIDYLQLDIDPSSNTYKALKNIPFDQIQFNVITYEHDYYVDNSKYRSKSREFLKEKNYILIASNISPDNHSPFEDWYVHKNYYNNSISNNDQGVLCAKDYVFKS